MNGTPAAKDPVSTAFRQEQDYFNARLVAGFAAVAVLLFAAGVLFCAVDLRHADRRMRGGKPMAPRLVGQAEVGMVYQAPFYAADRMARERVVARRRLSSYGWAGRGGVHVPIERAIEELLRDGSAKQRPEGGSSGP